MLFLSETHTRSPRTRYLTPVGTQNNVDRDEYQELLRVESGDPKHQASIRDVLANITEPRVLNVEGPESIPSWLLSNVR